MRDIGKVLHARRKEIASGNKADNIILIRLMERYYITGNTSDTGIRIQNILAGKKRFNEARAEFCNKYDIHATYSSKFDLCAVVAVDFNHTPIDVKDNWKSWKNHGKNSYTLKVRPKNKALQQDWNNLKALSIMSFEIDKVIGGADPFTMCGLIELDNGFAFIIGHADTYKLPADLKEISNIDYRRIINNLPKEDKP